MKTILTLCFVFITYMLFAQSGNIGIGTTTPNPSALLDVTANNKGLLIPRLTTSQKNAISSPANGLLVYQTDSTTGFYYYNGTIWNRIGPGASGPQGPQGPVGPQGPQGPQGATGPQGTAGINALKIISGYIDASHIYGTGFTVQRLANQKYTVTWSAGTFPSIAIPIVSGFTGTLALSSWSAAGDGSGSFTTSTSAATVWFTVTEVKP